MIALIETPLVRRMVPLVLAAVVTAVSVELIRRRKLAEQYSIVWFCTSLVLIVLAVFPDILIWLQGLLQTNYLTIVVLVCFGLAALMLLHFAVVVTRQSREIRQLTHRLALMDMAISEANEKQNEQDQQEQKT